MAFFIQFMVYTGLAQQHSPRPVMVIPDSFCISAQENKLHRMINEYRRRFNLPPIPLSRALCFLASVHVRDLCAYTPEEPCNLHSWSVHGPWKPFCYPADENKKNSVWDKPGEITGYPGKGYEIVYWENNEVVIDSIIAEWRSVSYFNSFLTNTGRWQDKKWEAIGIGIFQNYAAAWFGEATDLSGRPYVCGEKPPVPTTDTVKARKVETASGRFYLIVKGWITESEAKRQLPIVRENGYPDAKILLHDNKVRISVYETNSKADADSNLRIIRKKYKDAWILKY